MVNLPQRTDSDTHRRAVWLGLKPSGIAEADEMAKSKLTGVDPKTSTENRQDVKNVETVQTEGQPRSASTASPSTDKADTLAGGSQGSESSATTFDEATKVDENPTAKSSTLTGELERQAPAEDDGKVHAEDPDVGQQKRVADEAAARKDAEDQPASAPLTRRDGPTSATDFSPSLAESAPESRAVVDPAVQTDAALAAADKASGRSEDENKREAKRLEAGVNLTEQQLRERAMRQDL